MSRRTWKRDKLYISYGNPIIQTFSEKLIKSMDEVMYFYYDIDIIDENKTIFHAESYDFPKVHNLPNHIDYIIDMEEKDMFLYENFELKGFHRKKLYNFITLEDSFDMDTEYFYKIERMITYVKQHDEVEYNRYEEYTLTIGRCQRNKEGYSNGEPYGNAIFIKQLTKEDLLRLSQTAIDFCDVAMKLNNEQLKKIIIECPHCKEKQLLLSALNQKKENGIRRQQFTCTNCKKSFRND